MNRRQMLSSLLGAAAVLGTGTGGLAYANSRFRPRNLEGASATDPILIPLTPRLINTYVVMGERPILVDSGNPGNAGLMLTRLKRLGIDPRQVALILLTHGHADHFGSAKDLHQATGAPVAVHWADAEAVATGVSLGAKPVAEIGLWGRLVQWQVASSPSKRLEGVRPQILLQGEETLEGFGLHAKIVHTPGHTAGSVSLVFNQQAVVGDLFSADLLFANQPDNPYFAEDLPLVYRSIGGLLEQGVRSFHVGHGLSVNNTAVQRRFVAAN
jgi:hydroxyacylglutathione hydrolase